MILLLVVAVTCAFLGPALMGVGYLAGEMAVLLGGVAVTVLGVAGVAFAQRKRREGGDAGSG